MAIFKERMLTRDELFALFVACMIPIHIWSLVNAFTEVPAWVIKMSLWEVLGAVAYTQTFALFESVIIVLLLAAFLFLLPRFVVGNLIVPIGMMVVVVATAGLIILHMNSDWIEDRNAAALAVWGISIIVVLGALLFLVRRSTRMERLMQTVSDRFVVLAIFFLIIDLLSVLVVVTRNIGGAVS